MFASFLSVKEYKKKVDRYDTSTWITLYEDFLKSSEETSLLRVIDNSPWLNELKRRVQHYRYRYDYKARSIDQTMYLGLLPDWTEEINKRFVKQNLLKEKPDQLIVNEYQPGQGIAPHIDCISCFEDGIAIISLLWGSSEISPKAAR